MACPEYEDLVLELLENQLPASQRRALETHLSMCEPCRAFHAAQARLDRALATSLRRPVLPPDFKRRTLQRIAVEAALLPPEVRAEKKRQMETEFESKSSQLRKRLGLSFPGLLDLLGYGVAAVLISYLLCSVLSSRAVLSVRWSSEHLPDVTMTTAWATGAVCLVAGAAAAYKSRLARLVAEL